MSSENKEIIKFNKDFTRQEAIPEEGIKRAIEIMETGCLHRYNTPEGEISDVALLEKEYAEYVGAKYCAGLSSCGSAIYVALKSVGVKPGDKVLCNAFTLAPVPGAIENAGGIPIFIEIDENLLTDLDDLEKKAIESGAKFFLLSHMRGNIVDMDRVMEICNRLGITLVEDCAHTVGARWGNQYTGTFGKAGCYSTQTYKHMNSGEGGLLVSNDEDVIAKAILYSGSYMLFEKHISRPSVEVFNRHQRNIPNFSLRMSNLVAALLRPQLANLDKQLKRWNKRYEVLAKGLQGANHIRIPKRAEKEHFVASSFQFTLTGINIDMVDDFIALCGERGVEIKWFGAQEPKGFTSSWETWEYIEDIQELPQTRKVLDFLCDFRIPLTFSLEDCEVITKVIRQVAEEIFN